MFSWFETKALIRTKFKVLLGIHAIWGVLGFAGAWFAGAGDFQIGVAGHLEKL